jgi:diguanylate cyclase (GGDEF)-like protein
MRSRKDRWGIAIFLLSPLMIAALLLGSGRIPPHLFVSILRLLPYIGCTLSVLCLFLGHFSYPRVHNLKVYLLSYTAALIGLALFVPMFPSIHNGPSLFLLAALSQFNLLLITLYPSYVKYRTTRLVTVVTVVAELSFLILVVTNRVVVPPGFIKPQATVQTWSVVYWPLLILLVTFSLMRREFHLGGIITGCSYFYAVVVLILMGSIPKQQLTAILFFAAQVYLVAGIVLHWFSRTEHRVSYDPLLQIYNRNFCSRIIEEQTRLNTTPPFGVAMIDIDHFKRVNDTWGHQAGDSVLMYVAQTIQNEVVPEGILCRYGGEELAVFFPKMESRDIRPLIENVRSRIESLRVYIGKKKTISVTVSCGVAHRNNISQSIVHVIKAADKALYRAKEGGRNRVICARIRD